MQLSDVKNIAGEINRLERDFLGRDMPKSNLAASRKWADALKRGAIFFDSLRRQEVAIGLKDIDWSGRHMAHNQWPAQLNRFFWLPHLGVVYKATGDKQMPALARATIEDWIVHHDYGADKPLAPGDLTLDLSIRVGQADRLGWWGAVRDFAGCPEFDAAFVERMLTSTRGQIEYLAGHLSSAGNWRISQLHCILFCSLALPGFETYRAFAVRHLNEAFQRQIHDDGSHEEHNPDYHGWMCRVFTGLWRMSRARPQLGLHLDTQKAARMWDYLVCSHAPDGGSSGLHDSGVWQKGPGVIAGMKERQAFLKDAGLKGKAWDLRRQPSRWFASAGQLFLRDGWKPDASFIAFDATRWGGGHCHLSRLSVNLYAGGRMLTCDPGVFNYEMSDPYAPYGKSTPAHNTVNVGGMSQTEADPITRAVHIGERYALAASCYAGGYFSGVYKWGWEEGKGPGIYGVHDRVLLWLKGRGVLVLDQVRTDGRGQPYAAHWQLPKGPVTVEERTARAWTGGEKVNLLLHVLEGRERLRLVVHEGEKTPLRGWLPGTEGYEPAPLLAAEGCAETLACDIAFLLVPFKGRHPPAVTIEAYVGHTQPAFGFRLAWPDGAEDIVAYSPALATQVGVVGPVSSDGSLAVVSLVKGAPRAAFLCDGTILKFEGRALIDARKPGVYESPNPSMRAVRLCQTCAMQDSGYRLCP